MNKYSSDDGTSYKLICDPPISLDDKSYFKQNAIFKVFLPSTDSESSSDNEFVELISSRYSSTSDYSSYLDNQTPTNLLSLFHNTIFNNEHYYFDNSSFLDDPVLVYTNPHSDTIESLKYTIVPPKNVLPELIQTIHHSLLQQMFQEDLLKDALNSNNVLHRYISLFGLSSDEDGDLPSDFCQLVVVISTLLQVPADKAASLIFK
jgi:hypothetical protein